MNVSYLNMNSDIFTFMKHNGYLTNTKCMEPQTSPDELNTMCSYVTHEASMELCELDSLDLRYLLITITLIKYNYKNNKAFSKYKIKS